MLSLIDWGDGFFSKATRKYVIGLLSSFFNCCSLSGLGCAGERAGPLGFRGAVVAGFCPAVIQQIAGDALDHAIVA